MSKERQERGLRGVRGGEEVRSLQGLINEDEEGGDEEEGEEAERTDEEKQKLEELKQEELQKVQEEALVKQKKRTELMGELLRSKGFLWMATSHDGKFNQ